MADYRKRNRKKEPRDTPPSEEAKQQRQSGMKAAPRAEGGAGRDRQPRQGSQRNEGHGPPPEVRRHYEPGRAPSDQGVGKPSPGRGTGSASQQGLAASNRRSGSHHTHGERGADEATEK